MDSLEPMVPVVPVVKEERGELAVVVMVVQEAVSISLKLMRFPISRLTWYIQISCRSRWTAWSRWCRWCRW
jgi:hypothetical protein